MGEHRAVPGYVKDDCPGPGISAELAGKVGAQQRGTSTLGANPEQGIRSKVHGEGVLQRTGHQQRSNTGPHVVLILE